MNSRLGLGPRLFASIAFAAGLATGAGAETIELSAKMSGVAQVPANPTKGEGSTAAVYDTVSRKLTWTGNFSNLTGQAIGAHFHGPADVTRNAPIAVHIHPLVSPFQGEATLTAVQAEELLSGQWYVNVHTPSYPGGEIRGQVGRAAK